MPRVARGHGRTVDPKSFLPRRIGYKRAPPDRRRMRGLWRVSPVTAVQSGSKKVGDRGHAGSAQRGSGTRHPSCARASEPVRLVCHVAERILLDVAVGGVTRVGKTQAGVRHGVLTVKRMATDTAVCAGGRLRTRRRLRGGGRVHPARREVVPQPVERARGASASNVPLETHH